jgi:hypothetical protein
MPSRSIERPSPGQLVATPRGRGQRAWPGLAFLLALLTASSLPAGVVWTLDGKQHRGELSLAKDALRIQTGESNRVEVPLAQLQGAVFHSPATDLAQLGELRGGWASRDVGDVSVAGQARQSSNTFSIRVAAPDAQDDGDGFHFVYQQASGDVEIQARLSSIVGPDRLARASLTVRESLSAGGPYALVGVNASGQLCFQSRTAWGTKARTQVLESVGLPHWVRLVKTGLRLSAYHSANGRDWQPAGMTNTTLAGMLYVGMALTTHGTFEVAQARFERVRLTVSGLHGEYFADGSFQQLALTRVDARPEFWWGHAPPAEGLPPGPFSVRWTGQLAPPSSGDWMFQLEADGPGRCWVRDQLVAEATTRRQPASSAPIYLEAGQRHDVRLEYQKLGDRGSLRLTWVGPGQKRETVPSDRLYCVPDFGPATNAPAPTVAVPVGAAKGVWLGNGSFIAGQVKSVDEKTVKLAVPGDGEVTVPTRKVAVAFIHVPRRRQIPEPGLAGVLLSNGDFFEGEFRRIEGGSVKVSSVLFGMRTFWLGEVAGIYLGAVTPAAALFEVRTVEGSAVRASDLALTQDALSVEEPSAGRLRFASKSLLEIRRLGP